MKRAFIEWKNDYCVGIKEVDDQHRKLLDIINNLHAGLASGEEYRLETFKTAIKSAVKYVEHHFITEERMMEQADYKGMAEHKERHREFIANLISEVEKFERGDEYAPNHFLRFLIDWLMKHISYEDKRMAKAVKEALKI